jgi:hypothetical protein
VRPSHDERTQEGAVRSLPPLHSQDPAVARAAGGTARDASALDLEYDVGLSVGYDDNLSLTEDNEISDTIVTPLVRFTAEQDGPRVQLQARGDFRYPMYLDNTFDDRSAASSPATSTGRCCPSAWTGCSRTT